MKRFSLYVGIAVLLAMVATTAPALASIPRVITVGHEYAFGEQSLSTAGLNAAGGQMPTVSVRFSALYFVGTEPQANVTLRFKAADANGNAVNTVAVSPSSAITSGTGRVHLTVTGNGNGTDQTRVFIWVFRDDPNGVVVASGWRSVMLRAPITVIVFIALLCAFGRSGTARGGCGRQTAGKADATTNRCCVPAKRVSDAPERRCAGAVRC